MCGSGGGHPRLPIPNSPCACGLVNDGLGGEGGGWGGGDRVQELCRSQGGRPGLPVPNSPCSRWGHEATLNLGKTEFRSCVKVEGAVQGSPSLIVLSMVSVDVKQH